MSAKKQPRQDEQDVAETGPGDDTRDRFRAALERKKSGAGGGGRPSGPAHDKASDATASHKTHREFRRKSGG